MLEQQYIEDQLLSTGAEVASRQVRENGGWQHWPQEKTSVLGTSSALRILRLTGVASPSVLADGIAYLNRCILDHYGPITARGRGKHPHTLAFGLWGLSTANEGLSVETLATGRFCLNELTVLMQTDGIVESTKRGRVSVYLTAMTITALSAWFRTLSFPHPSLPASEVEDQLVVTRSLLIVGITGILRHARLDGKWGWWPERSDARDKNSSMTARCVIALHDAQTVSGLELPDTWQAGPLLNPTTIKLNDFIQSCTLLLLHRAEKWMKLSEPNRDVGYRARWYHLSYATCLYACLLATDPATGLPVHPNHGGRLDDAWSHLAELRLHEERLWRDPTFTSQMPSMHGNLYVAMAYTKRLDNLRARQLVAGRYRTADDRILNAIHIEPQPQRVTVGLSTSDEHSVILSGKPFTRLAWILRNLDDSGSISNAALYEQFPELNNDNIARAIALINGPIRNATDGTIRQLLVGLRNVGEPGYRIVEVPHSITFEEPDRSAVVP